MKYVRTAGFWNKLVKKIKDFWVKQGGFFENSDEYKECLELFKQANLNVDPSAMEVFIQNNKRYINNDGDIFLLTDKTNKTDIESQLDNTITKLLDTLEEKYPIESDTKTYIHDQFEKHFNKLQFIQGRNLSLIAIK